jgi:O-antigen ligase
MTPAKSWRWPPQLGLAGLYVWALFGWLGTAGAAIGSALLLAAFLCDRKAWATLAHQRIAWLVGVMCLYLLARTALAAWEFPVTQSTQFRSATRWFQLMLFLPLAWYLGGNIRRMNHVWTLAAGGLLMGALLYLLDPQNSHILGSATRTGFHINAPIAFGLYSGVVVLGLLVLAPRIWGMPDHVRAWRVAAWLGMLALMIQLLLQTLSRGPLLAMALVTPVALLIRYGVHGLLSRHRVSWAIAALTAVSLVGLLLTNHSALMARIQSEPQAIAAIVSGKPMTVPATSNIGARLRLWKFAFDEGVKHRPVIGWGPGSTKYLLDAEKTDLFGSWRGLYFHLHNTYAEVFFCFGFVGALLGFMLVAMLASALRWAVRNTRLPSDYAIFLVAVFAVTAIWMLFDFRSLKHDWRFFWNLLAGSTLTFYLHRTSRHGSEH